MPTNTIRLSLSAIVLIFGVLFCISVAGGALGSRIFTIPLPLRSDTNGTIVPVSQQVTVSPSKLATELTINYGKSVFLLAHKTPKGIAAFGTGVALTNDGIIMSVAELAKETIVGIGEDGVAFSLAPVGYDELSGISFYKASDRIVTPFNLLQHTPLVGSSFLALYRQNDTAQISANTISFSTTLLPSEINAPGIQKIAQLESATILPVGTALLDENGNLAGVLLDPEKNTALFTSDIRSALERLSSNRLAYNPYTLLGFTHSWKAQLDANGTIHIKNSVTSVTNNSPASTAGLKAGDILTAIGGNAVSWDTNTALALNVKPLILTIMRQEEQRTISISP